MNNFLLQFPTPSPTLSTSLLPRGEFILRECQWVIISLVLVFLSGCSTVPKTFHPEQPLAPQTFSHTVFQAVLEEHVSDGIVKYPRIANDSRFLTYIDQLNRVDPNALPTRNDQLSFWINSYNAFAIKGILDGYSPRTKFGQYRYFIGREYMVGGEALNLNNLEKKILIQQFREPRIHFAIVCASQSCPKLRSWAYTTKQLEEQLNDSARRFINDSSKNYFDRKRRVAYLSKIFDWFTEDFVAHSGSVTVYVSQFVEDPVLANELRTTPYEVEFLDYDWNLNGIPPDL